MDQRLNLYPLLHQAAPPDEIGQRDHIDWAKRQSFEHWGGRTWVHDFTQFQGAGGGELGFNCIPGEGNEMELQSVFFDNVSAGAELIRAAVAWRSKPAGEGPTAAVTEFIMINGGLGNGSVTSWPATVSTTAALAVNRETTAHKVVIAGTMSLWAHVDDIPLGQDFRWVIVARVRGDKPKVIPFSGGGSGLGATNIATDRFYS